MNLQRIMYLIAVVAAGVATLLASSVEEETPRPPPVPTTVQITLSSRTDDFSRELETRTANISDLNFSASYASTQGTDLTADHTSVALDTTSGFQIDIVAKTTDELLAGSALFDVSESLDVGLSHDPVAGQFSSLYDGTSTVVTVAGSAVDILVGAAATPENFNWTAFRDAANDTNESLDIRMASAAYNMLAVLVRTALLGEDLIDEVEQNKVTLEGLNLNTSLQVECDNTAAQGTFESRLLWTTDAVGTGQGAIGIGDAFEARYRNCRNTLRDRFLEGNVVAENYVPETGSGLRSFAINLQLSEVFVSTIEVGVDSSASADTPRYDGDLALLYSESVTATAY